MRGLLISQMDPPLDRDDDFHAWYDDEHIPVRLALPGFESALRCQSTGSATRFLVCYFIDDLDVLKSADYQQIKAEPGPRTERMLGEVRDFTRFTCELTADTADHPLADHSPADYLVVHVVQCHPEGAGEFERRSASIAKVLVDSGASWVRVRGYRTFGANVGGAWTHISLYESSGSLGGLPRLPDAEGLEQESWWDYRVIRRAHSATGEVTQLQP